MEGRTDGRTDIYNNMSCQNSDGRVKTQRNEKKTSKLKVNKFDKDIGQVDLFVYLVFLYHFCYITFICLKIIDRN